MKKFKKINQDNFFTELIKEFPEFNLMYEKHVREYGEVVRYVLMFEFVNFVIDMHRKIINDLNHYDKNLLNKIWDYLEKIFTNSSDCNLKNMISIEIGERFATSRSAMSDIYDDVMIFFGPNLRKEVEKYKKN